MVVHHLSTNSSALANTRQHEHVANVAVFGENLDRTARGSTGRTGACRFPPSAPLIGRGPVDGPVSTKNRKTANGQLTSHSGAGFRNVRWRDWHAVVSADDQTRPGEPAVVDTAVRSVDRDPRFARAYLRPLSDPVIPGHDRDFDGIDAPGVRLSRICQRLHRARESRPPPAEACHAHHVASVTCKYK